MNNAEENITIFKKIEVFDSINIDDETKERLENIEVDDLEVRIYTSKLDSLSKNMKTPYETIKKILEIENIPITTNDIKIFLHTKEQLKDLFGDDFEEGYEGYMLFKTQKTWYNF